ncbi:MAG: thiamine pyrophosphate-dependent enzyme [Acidobacteriota bacterium]
MATKLREQIAVALSNGGQPVPLISHEKLRHLYSTMLMCRLLFERALNFQEQTGISYDLSLAPGLEATVVGTVIDLRPGDTLAPSHLDLIAGYVKSEPLTELFNQLERRQTTPHDDRSAGGDYAHAPLNILASATTVAAQLERCTNIAFRNRRMTNENIAVAFSSEGSISQLEWRNALRFAGKHSLAIVYVRLRNRIASMTCESMENDADIDPIKYGFPGITVDARDVVAVYRVAQEAIERARSGRGPTLIEAALTVPGRGTFEIYRPEDATTRETEDPEFNDPIKVMERYLMSKRLFSEGWKDEIMASFQRELDAAIDAAEIDRCGARV